MTKKDYHELKRQLKLKSHPELNHIIKDAGLTKYETDLLYSFCENETITKMAYDRYISANTCTKYLKHLVEKLFNYYNYTKTV